MRASCAEQGLQMPEYTMAAIGQADGLPHTDIGSRSTCAVDPIASPVEAQTVNACRWPPPDRHGSHPVNLYSLGPQLTTAECVHQFDVNVNSLVIKAILGTAADAFLLTCLMRVARSMSHLIRYAPTEPHLIAPSSVM